MKKTFLLIALSALFVLLNGCRREDFREHTFEIPGMTSENIDTIKNAIYVYGGVVKDSLEFNLDNKTLKVRFDSMKIAQTNIRMAIEEKGIKVTYPEKKVTYPMMIGEPAGYINTRDKEVK